MSFFFFFFGIVLCSVNSFASNIAANINSKSWKDDIMIVLGVMDLDLAFRVTRPTDLIEQGTATERCEIKK